MRSAPNEPDSLRSEAEARLAHAWPMGTNSVPVDEIIHELQVHEIELEMQNENLRHSAIELEESRDRYIDFYDFAPVGYLTLSSQGLIIAANITCATMLGIERGKLLRDRFSKFVAPENNDDWYRHLKAVLQHDGKQSCELDIRCGHGGHLHVQLDSSRLLKDNLEPMVRIALTDITRIMLAEIALQESEEHLRLLEQREIVQTSLDGYCSVRTKDGRLLDVNDAYCQMVGYSRQELLTMHISDLEMDESPKEILNHIKKIMTTGHDRFETRQRHKLGYLIHVEVSASHAELDGGVNYAFMRDITERKYSDELLRRSYEEVKDLYNNAACGYHSLDENGIICRINDTELAWLGYTRDELVGKVLLPDLMTPASRQTFHQSFPRLKSTGFSHDLEIDLIRKDGTILNGLINATAIYDPSGNYVMSRSALTDISKLRQAQRQLRDLTTHIQSVREDEKAHLAREIHDDLGGTLAAIKIEASRIKRELPDNMKITGRIDSMSEMINSAMTFTRHIITDLRPSILDDLGLMAALEWQADEFYKRTGIECRIVCVSGKDNCGTACKDCKYKLGKALSINLFRIFQEALTNVSRHSGASRVEAGFRPCDNEVVLSICDNGCGLPEGHTIASTSYGIRGMRERVEQMGGKIQFDSTPGNGLSVTVNCLSS
jgi:PAS domain S-box-containing protein